MATGSDKEAPQASSSPGAPPPVSQEPVFKPLSAQDEEGDSSSALATEPTEIESMCVECQENVSVGNLK